MRGFIGKMRIGFVMRFIRVFREQQQIGRIGVCMWFFGNKGEEFVMEDKKNSRVWLVDFQVVLVSIILVIKLFQILDVKVEIERGIIFGFVEFLRNGKRRGWGGQVFVGSLLQVKFFY